MAKTIHSDGHRRLRETMKAARQDADQTQAEVAGRLGEHQSFVAKYEGGERRIDVVEFVRIAEAIGIDPTELFARFLMAWDRSGHQNDGTPS